MSNVIMYTRKEPYCYYCDEAKKMLKYYGVEYENIVIGEDISRYKFLMDFPNVKTVPAVFFDETYIGGLKELKERVWELSGNNKGMLYG